MASAGTFRLAAIADLHCRQEQHGRFRELVKMVNGEAKVQVLDGDHAVFDRRLGIAGVKGFAGGFEHGMLQAFGEPAVKAFVQEAVNEALKLEAALAQLDYARRVVIMHYAPVAATTDGERVEIRPFLGTTRLVAPCEAFGADAIFHGHAHHGAPEAMTPKGIPVYNVAMPVLKRVYDRKFRIVEVGERDAEEPRPETIPAPMH